MNPKLIIHGGFFSESGTNHEVKVAKQQALARIAQDSQQYLLTHTALETVVYAVSLLEDCDLFNAGTGSQIQSDGKIRLSASLMDGKTMKFSGVINLQDVQNPVKVAQVLQNYDDSILADVGAIQFARSKGFTYYNSEIPQRRKEYEAKLAATRLGTVGCVALDANGNIAASTSTGGKGFEIPGRVSDSATVAGNYANADAGVSCTGVGEDIIRVSMASRIVTRITDGMDAKTALDRTFAELKTFDGFAGVVGLTKEGHIFHTDSHPYMVYAWCDGITTKVFE